MSSEIILNKDQLEAVNTIKGNLLIIASAGTGKTTTIVERYINLVENHKYHPNEILMTTFTNKAAKDMIRKISAKTKKLPAWAGTMHSLFLRILRENSNLIFKDPNFTILADEHDKKKIIMQILAKENIEITKDNVAYFLDRISRFKNAGVSADLLGEDSYSEEVKGKIEEAINDEFIIVDPTMEKHRVKIYKKYQNFLRENKIIDLDDILLLTYELFRKHENILKKYSDKFKIIMVDEAQDLNVVQMNILELLQNNNLCLIGDDCQNIYEWRGSSNKLVFEFDKNAKKVVLKENYRSTKKIISAVNKTINSFRFKIEKELIGTREEGSDIVIESFFDFKEEIEFIVSEVKMLLRKKIKIEEIAILFRTNNIGKRMEREFRRNKIPCHLSRSRGFFEREEVRDILSFLKLKLNPNLPYDFERILQLVPGIGKSKVEKLKEISIKKKCSLLDSLDQVSELKLNEETNAGLKRLKKAFLSGGDPVKIFIQMFDYKNRLIKKYGDDPKKLEDKQENINLIMGLHEGHSNDLEGLRDFLDSLIELERKEKDKDKIVLTTVHGAKGLEWRYVFLAGCNEKILPFYKKSLEVLKRDSELRLFYVAISRAKDFLIITHSEKHDWRELDPSHFLEIIE